LQSHYEAIVNDGTVSIYYGMGYEMYANGNEETFALMLKSKLTKAGVGFQDFFYDQFTRNISFERTSDHVWFDIKVGHERNEWIAAWETHEVVLYQGHSRYGRGPTFGDWNSYFRFGPNPAIEVDGRSPFFRNEPILNTARYPVQRTTVNGEEILYQYRGSKDPTAKLPDDSYTKNIEGNAKDFRNTNTLGGKQIFWLYSCKNRQYWRNEFRSRFPENGDKFVFGTIDDSFWSLEPAATFLTEIVKQTRESRQIVNKLNTLDDCNQCFTSW
jgi:hypothetical protein